MKFLARAWNIGYDIITKGNIKTLVQEAKEKTQEDDILKKINKNTYNGLILEQDDTACLQIVE